MIILRIKKYDGINSLHLSILNFFTRNICFPKMIKMKKNKKVEKKKISSLLFKESLIQNASKATAHGLSHIANAQNKFNFAVWLCIFVISFICCMMLFTKTIQDYLEYPVTTKSRFIYEDKSQFPGIAICHSNPLKTDYAIDFAIDYLERYTDYSYRTEQNKTKLEFLNEYFINEKLKEMQTYLINLDESTLKKIGMPLEDLIISCEFVSKQCNLSDFKWQYHRNHGSCYVINHDNKKETLSPGIYLL